MTLLTNVVYRCTLTCFDAKFTNDSTEKRSGGWTQLNASASDGVIESHLVYKPIALSNWSCPSRIGFPDVFAARQHARILIHWSMFVVSCVAALLGGKATASSILMLGLCCQQEVRTGVFSSDSCCRRQQLRVYFFPSDSQHNSKKKGDPTLAVPVVASGTGCRVGFPCELFLCRGQRENWHVSCSAGETADAQGTKVSEKAKLDVDSKFGHVLFLSGFLAWLPGALVPGCAPGCGFLEGWQIGNKANRSLF